jgi:hypothetical protein
MLRRAGLAILLLIALGTAILLALPGPDRSAGRIAGAARPAAAVAAAGVARTAAAGAIGAGGRRRILFGDLHVHTTFSIDALVYSTPLFGGEGAHPPADACDFARYCAAVDFFSINDHAEGLTPERWRETVESIRRCNALAGDPANPDLVAYVGWEWTQTGPTPDTHYGHRNVIFPGLADDQLPARPITALPDGSMSRARAMGAARAAERLGRSFLGGWGEFLWLTARMVEVPDCPTGVPSPELPAGCRENAATPAELSEKLAQWHLETLVIPHGLAWGLHAPPGASLDHSLAGGNHDPRMERLLEVFSGHGNSEEFRDVPDRSSGTDGAPLCPEPTRDHLACCWRAGEIVRARCGDLPEAECEARVEEARRLALAAGNEPHRVFPDTRPEDWLDCDQCRDCFKPTLSLRPRETAQYSLAVSAFDEPGAGGQPQRFRWGFIASTDGHEARPATGYKQYERRRMTDARGIASERADRLSRGWIIGRQADPGRAQAVPEEPRGLRGLFDVERVASFMYPGGVVAAHADGRDRRSIWDALVRREVYGTSGPRILLWFDLLNAPGEPAPMGSEVALAEDPVFEVRAVGDFVQEPGCPLESVRGLAPERLERLCRGECYHPGDARHPIVAIEIVRVRPQRHSREPVAGLIEDPWRRFPCAPDPAGCTVRFEDPEFATAGRDAVYYARALQEATPAINAANLRAEFDADGNAVRVSPCHGGWRTPADEDCLAPARERAWSSPLFVDFAPRP